MTPQSRRQFLVAVGTAAMVGAFTQSALAQRASANVHHVIASYQRRMLRAGLTPPERLQLTVDASGTAHGDGHVLALLACDNVVRVLLPTTLDAAGRADEASALRSINPISSDAGAGAVVDRLNSLGETLEHATDCRGAAACATNAAFQLGRMAREAAAACQGASAGNAGDDHTAEHVATAVEAGMHIAAARSALVTGAASLLLGMTATAR